MLYCPPSLSSSPGVNEMPRDAPASISRTCTNTSIPHRVTSHGMVAAIGRPSDGTGRETVSIGRTSTVPPQGVQKIKFVPAKQPPAPGKEKGGKS